VNIDFQSLMALAHKQFCESRLEENTCSLEIVQLNLWNSPTNFTLCSDIVTAYQNDLAFSCEILFLDHVCFETR